MMNFNGPKAPKQTLQGKQEEKARLLSKFKAHRREEWAKLTAKEPRLAQFKKAIRDQSPQDIARLVHLSWLRTAHKDIQYAALRLIDKEAARQTRSQGGEPLDDPLPPQRNLYLVAREVFALR